MKEMTGAVTMYDAVEEIKNLNWVQGFDPRQYMRTITSDSGVTKQYLDVVYRKLWFRLKNPDGKIVKKLIKLTEQTAIVEARVYLHKDDTEDSFISNALAQKFFSQDEQFGNKFLELAETAAVGRALADAGYGLQFADLEGELDPNVVDAPLEAGSTAATNYTAESYEEASGTGVIFQNQQAPAQNSRPAQNQAVDSAANEYQNQADNQQIAFDTASMTAGMPPAFGGGMPAQNPVQTVANQASAGQLSNKLVFTKDMPVEQIYAGLDYQTAAAVVIPIGFHKNKTLGQIAFDKPSDLAWYMNGGYKGPDNILRAAAKYLIDKAVNRAA